MKHIVFYGSLMSTHSMQRELNIQDQLELVGACELAGTLFDLGDYPAFLPGEGTVFAELYELKDQTIIEVLDAYEGYDASNPEQSLYLRQAVQLLRPHTMAWVYVYNQSTTDFPQILSGKWQKGQQ